MCSKLDFLKPSDFREVLERSSLLVEVHSPGLNELNVFPISNHDTGDNATGTLSAVAGAVVGSESSFAKLGATVNSATLHGSKGKSGQALRSFLAGLCEVFTNLDTVGPGDLAVGLDVGAQNVADAFASPVNGTVIEVSAALAAAALSCADSGGALDEVVFAACAAGLDALEATTAQLEVLAEAGVVDAGGAALLIVLDAMASVVDGETIESLLGDSNDFADEVQQNRLDALNSNVVLVDVAVTVSSKEVDARALGAEWASRGHEVSIESVSSASVSVEGLDAEWQLGIRCHPDLIGSFVEAALGVGTVSNVSTELLAGPQARTDHESAL